MFFSLSVSTQYNIYRKQMYIYNICETMIHSHKNSLLLTILFYISQLDKTQTFWPKAFNVLNISVPPPTFSSIIYRGHHWSAKCAFFYAHGFY